ncbi:hypothetical protein LR948_06565 [Roseivivax sp. GX 12232]|uniref:hypothetical protein n=1 Tax=Roseivivax sp. GX 12232 TaxID=2900547 RepID=UPI001E5F3777|nr:hypothetical protein [Roseivivax sp. GX 12232]MCE0505006.1 hypothetical protein [Roseivivax sp. GX 12232]
MFTTSPIVTDSDGTDKAVEAALGATDFLRRHGAGLCDLLDLAAGPTAFDALCDLHAQSGSVCPDTYLVRGALRTIHEALASVQASTLDEVSLRAGYCVGTALRWYGARISDLLAGFH